MNRLQQRLAWALLAALLVLGWQWLTVHYNFHGDWSALFYTGSRGPVPEMLESERVFQIPSSDGWDGQFYHYAAHDPLLRNGLWKAFDFPRLRYRRILLPGLAYLLAGGNSQYVDTAYRIAILLFVFAGAYWLAAIVEGFGRSPAWGLAFLLIPGAITSVDRMGVDVALAALCLGFMLYADRGASLFGVLVLAGLARETGLLLTAAYCLSLLIQKKPLRAMVFATAALPALGWFLYVNSRTPAYLFDGAVALPFSGAIDRLIHPLQYPFGPLLTLWMKGLDAMALGGILLSFVMAFAVARKNRWNPQGIAMVAFAVLGILVWRPGDWLEAYDYGRILSPLLVLLALNAFASQNWLQLAPLCLILPRFGMQVASQVAGVVKGLI